MPLQATSRTPITQRVSDRQIAGTIIRQVATFKRLTHSQENGVCTATVLVEVIMFAAADGDELGPELSTWGGFSKRTVELVANNLTLVDAATGEILAIRTTEPDVVWQARIDSYAQNTMLQGDWFEYLRENQAVNIGDMIRQNITQADEMGRFA